ncbi:MAG: type I methionyl aminopeptidase [Candidatus Aminicenantes bacterium]|nr:type I methionyl aminopeptidase [Candidatus Aminicenantes bacterium]
MIIIKTEDEIKKMREAGRITGVILQEVAMMIKPGVSTLKLNEYAEKRTQELGAKPAFKNYPHPSGLIRYPASICISINEEVVHGIPSREKIIKEGDIVSLDFGVVKNGYYGDSALTVGVEPLDERKRELIEVTEKALYKGIAVAKPGARLSDISNAVQTYVESHGFGIVRDFTGHGIGSSLHEEPQIPNFGPPGKGPILQERMTMAIEPMVTMGDWRVTIKSDGWTAVTVDGLPSAHFEHTIVIRNGEAEILTKVE